ncbi:MAG: response regulator [Planctomycetota bacterium]
MATADRDGLKISTDAPSLLIVDDDARFRERLARAFADRGYDVRVAPDHAAATTSAESDSPEFALVDLRLAGGEWGLHVVRSLAAIDPDTAIVVLTAYGSIATAMEAVRLGAKTFLQKPATVDEIEVAFKGTRLGPSEDPPVPAAVPSLARAEWEHINRVLTECDGNISRAARLLGLHRRSLQRKLAKFPQPS